MPHANVTCGPCVLCVSGNEPDQPQLERDTFREAQLGRDIMLLVHDTEVK